MEISIEGVPSNTNLGGSTSTSTLGNLKNLRSDLTEGTIFAPTGSDFVTSAGQSVNPNFEIPGGSIGGSLVNAGAGLGASFAGDKLGGAFVPQSKQQKLGSSAGAVAGGILTGGNPIGVFVGATLGGLIGSIFGGERLSKEEREFGAIFTKLKDDGRFTAKQALAITRLARPDLGGDSAADAINNITGRDSIGGTSFLRDEGGKGLSIADELQQFPESIDSLSAQGFQELVDTGLATQQELDGALAKSDLVRFQPLGIKAPEPEMAVVTPEEQQLLDDTEAKKLRETGIDQKVSDVNTAQDEALSKFRGAAGIDSLRASLNQSGIDARNEIQQSFGDQFRANELQRTADLARRGLSSSSRATNESGIVQGFSNETNQRIQDAISALTGRRLEDQQGALTSGINSIKSGFTSDLTDAMNNIRGTAGSVASTSALNNFNQSVSEANDRFQSALSGLRSSDNRSQAFKSFRNDSRSAAIKFNADQAQDKKNAIKVAALRFGMNNEDETNPVNVGIATPVNTSTEQTIANP